MSSILDLNNDIIILILNYLGIYKDYKNLKDTCKFFKFLLHNSTDAIYYIDQLNYNTILLYQNYEKFYKYIFFNQIIIINNIKQLFFFNLSNLKLLDINLYETNFYYEHDYDIINEDILKLMYNLKYLNISDSNFNYIPENLNKLEYLNISDTRIKTIPNTLINLKYLINVSYYNNNLKYIPKNISLNLEYLEIINICNKSIYLSNKIKYLDSYEGEKNNYNKTSIYINNIKLNLINCSIKYIKKDNKINNNYFLMPKLYFYCFT